MKPRQVNILEGSTFMVSDVRGDVVPEDEQSSGLFFRDMRHLSRWEIRLNGRELEALSGDAIEYDQALFYLAEPTGTVYRNAQIGIVRARHIGGRLRERLEVSNYSGEPRSLEISILFAADFADLFEVKDQTPKAGSSHDRVGDGAVLLWYQRQDFRRETRITAPGAYCTDRSLTWRISLAAGQTWTGEVDVAVGSDTPRPVPRRPRQPTMTADLNDWLDEAPRLDTEWDDLARTYRRSLIDLAALRFYPDGAGGASLPAAGLPWFMALFGRDSLITSYQALPFVPELCRTTLTALAARQATETDDFRDAEPGKILHELRHGELTHFHQWPQSPYYGTADATSLFLVVLDEYERWTGDVDTVRSLEPAARAAVDWLDHFSDSNHDGFVDYQTRNPTHGLVNQCWKDSWNSIVHPDGSLAALPRATCELQGYAYDARRRTARLARQVWHDADLAARLDRDADRLREAFDAAYWMPAQDCYALALDGHGEQVRTLASNAGQLLWSGIVRPERVAPLVARLLDDRLCSGWGVRTMASGQVPYNPMEYHNGTVWPHDNSLIVAGLTRYGARTEAAGLALGILQAAAHFGHRLPEALVGVARKESPVPIAYPSACLPQAWATGAPLLLLRALLDLQPSGDALAADPCLPDRFGSLRLSGIPGRWGRTDVAAGA